MADSRTYQDTPFKFYMRWNKALLAADIDLPKGCIKATFISYCHAMSVHGSLGVDCFASDALICRELDICNRRDVAKYRHAAVQLGWMIPNGKRHGRAEGLNIAIPSPQVTPVSPKPDSPGKRQPRRHFEVSEIQPAAACEHPRKTMIDGELAKCDACGAVVAAYTACDTLPADPR